MKPSGRGRLAHALILVFLMVTGEAVAGSSGEGMVLRIMVEQEVAAPAKSGKHKITRIPASRIIPGDEVVYTIHYRNSSTRPAENVHITIPVAEHTSYRSGSARGADTAITFSVDGGKRFATPDKLSVKLPNGRVRPAEARDYTHIRWRFNKPVAPGASGAVSYRAVLN